MTAGGRSDWIAQGLEPGGGDEAILVELLRTEPERVRPRQSRWAALAIALFTAMTCAGLASQTIVPRPIDRAADRGAAAVSSVAPVAHGSPPIATHASAPAAPAPTAAVRVTRAELLRDGQARVHLAGSATVTVRSLEVTVSVGARIVGSAQVTVDPDATIVDGTAAVGRALWLVDVPLRPTAGGVASDAVAVAEVRWPASPAGPSGSVTSLIPIADGRNAP